MSHEKLRRAIEKRLKRPVPPEIWTYLEKKNFVSEAAGGGGHHDAIGWLAQEARKLLQLKEAPERLRPVQSRRRQRRQHALPLLREAISDLVAAHARTNDKVRSYREQFLPLGVLDPSAVVNWIDNNRKGARYGHALIVNLPIGTDLEIDAGGWRCKPPLSKLAGIAIENKVPPIMLDYATPESSWVQRVPVGRDGILRTLADLSASLALTYSWQPAQATMFVLTDLVPQISPNEVAVQRAPYLTFGKQGVRQIDCLTRFVITVDTRTAPKEVAELYAKARAKHLKKVKTLSTRQLVLAMFASRYAEVSNKAWADWNRTHPARAYGRYSNFARAVRFAIHRLMFTSAVDGRSLRLGIPQD